MDFEGRIAFITGGARGIGRRYARALTEQGAAVALADVDIEEAEKTAAELRETGATAIAVRCDVADETEVERVVDAVADELGGIDILINNAAKHLAAYNPPVTQLSRDRWRRLLDVNVIGVVNCSASCRPHMAKRGGGAIVNQSSIAGFMSIAAYGISKLAVRGLTVALAHEFAEDDIRVNGIAPGATESEVAVEAIPPERFDYFVQQQLIKRRESMDDLVGPMLFLCSDDSGFVTGETIIVGGGFPLRV
jgi:NAD(P)-dependent dehydrogenase (short-subunit alcohol dehydrogenase family)